MTLAGVPAPMPDLRIVAVKDLHPHELHDSQRSAPLVKQLESAELLINPPIVAPMQDGDDLLPLDEPFDRFEHDYVVLDGANRSFAFRELGYPHLLVQVVSYRNRTVSLSTWQHVIAGWSAEALVDGLRQVADVQVVDENVDNGDKHAMAWFTLRDGRVLTIVAKSQNLQVRNGLLREVVAGYQRQAALHRTAVHHLGQIWPFYPDAVAVVRFRQYQPDDIVEAARQSAYLAPGISRHIVHGRALRVNYPLAALSDTNASLEEKNAALQAWVRDRLAGRQVRFYAESTYLFDE